MSLTGYFLIGESRTICVKGILRDTQHCFSAVNSQKLFTILMEVGSNNSRLCQLEVKWNDISWIKRFLFYLHSDGSQTTSDNANPKPDIGIFSLSLLQVTIGRKSVWMYYILLDLLYPPLGQIKASKSSKHYYQPNILWIFLALNLKDFLQRPQWKMLCVYIIIKELMIKVLKE